MAGIIPHEFVHTRQHYFDHSGWPRHNQGNEIKWVGLGDLAPARRIKRQTIRVLGDAFVAVARGLTTVKGYYARNGEIQARMHEIMTCGHVQWQKMPVNKTELWAALVNMGVKAPAPVLDHLNKTEAGREALHDFRVLPGIKSSVAKKVHIFNLIHAYAGEADIQQALWDTQYPLLYGELLEFYGDRPGRERMEMGVNPRPVIEALYALKEMNDAALSDEQAHELASRIPPSLAAPFLNYVIEEYEETDGQSYNNAVQISEALLARSEVRASLFCDYKTIWNYGPTNEAPPLYSAVAEGHETMIRLLMEAGDNPFHRFTLVDMRGQKRLTDSALLLANRLSFKKECLADPSALPTQRARRFFRDNKETVEREISKLKTGLEALLEHCKTPDLKQETYSDDGSLYEATLREVLEHAGITAKNTNAQPAAPELQNV